MRKRNVTELVCILDQSGSMHGKEEAAVRGYNQIIKEQQKRDGEVYVTTAFFGDQCRVLYCHKSLWRVGELSRREFCAYGNTALFDAVGEVFDQVDGALSLLKGDCETKVLVFLITDGMENASVRYTSPEIRKRILGKTGRGMGDSLPWHLSPSFELGKRSWN